MWITFVNGRTVVRIASANILTRSKDICHFKDGTLFLRKGLPGCLTNSFFNLSLGEIHRSWFSCGRGISANFQSWQLLLRLLWPGIFLLKKYLRSYSPVPWLGIPTKRSISLKSYCDPATLSSHPNLKDKCPFHDRTFQLPLYKHTEA